MDEDDDTTIIILKEKKRRVSAFEDLMNEEDWGTEKMKRKMDAKSRIKRMKKTDLVKETEELFESSPSVNVSVDDLENIDPSKI